MSASEPSSFGRYTCLFCNKHFPTQTAFAKHFADCVWFRADEKPESEWKLTESDKDFLRSNRIAVE